MEVTLKEIWSCRGALQALMTQHKFAAKVSYRISKMVKAIEAEYAEIDKARIALVKKHAPKDDKGNPKDSIPPNTPEIEAFVKEFNDFLAAEKVELDIKPVELPEDAEISPGVLYDLDKFVTVHTVPELAK